MGKATVPIKPEVLTVVEAKASLSPAVEVGEVVNSQRVKVALVTAVPDFWRVAPTILMPRPSPVPIAKLMGVTEPAVALLATSSLAP
jgi:hypothetical protein